MYILVTLTSYSKSIFCVVLYVFILCFLTNGTKLHQVVKCTRASSSQSCTKLLILDEMKNIFVFMYSQSNILIILLIVSMNQKNILTKNGIRPFSLSKAIASFNLSPRKLSLSSLSMYRILTRPTNPAFSTEEWA